MRRHWISLYPPFSPTCLNPLSLLQPSVEESYLDFLHHNLEDKVGVTPCTIRGTLKEVLAPPPHFRHLARSFPVPETEACELGKLEVPNYMHILPILLQTHPVLLFATIQNFILQLSMKTHHLYACPGIDGIFFYLWTCLRLDGQVSVQSMAGSCWQTNHAATGPTSTCCFFPAKAIYHHTLHCIKEEFTCACHKYRGEGLNVDVYLPKGSTPTGGIISNWSSSVAKVEVKTSIRYFHYILLHRKHRIHK